MSVSASFFQASTSSCIPNTVLFCTSPPFGFSRRASWGFSLSPSFGVSSCLGLLPLRAAAHLQHILAEALLAHLFGGSSGKAPAAPTGLRVGWNQCSSWPPPAQAPHRALAGRGCTAGAARAAAAGQAAAMAPRQHATQAELTGCFLKLTRTPRGVFSSAFLYVLHFLSSALCPPCGKCWFM